MNCPQSVMIISDVPGRQDAALPRKSLRRRGILEAAHPCAAVEKLRICLWKFGLSKDLLIVVPLGQIARMSALRAVLALSNSDCQFELDFPGGQA